MNEKISRINLLKIVEACEAEGRFGITVGDKSDPSLYEVMMTRVLNDGTPFKFQFFATHVAPSIDSYKASILNSVKWVREEFDKRNEALQGRVAPAQAGVVDEFVSTYYQEQFGSW